MLPPDRMKLYMSVAAYRSVTTMTHHCWTRDMAFIAARHDAVLGTWSNDALISRTRSIMLSAFLDASDADVLVWVDADITWKGPQRDGYDGDLLRLARVAYKTEGLVGGVYSKRGFGGGVACRASEPMESFDTGTDRLIKGHAVSAGFFAVHRNGLDKIAKELPYVSDSNGSWQPFCMPYLAEYDGALRYLSEDWALCFRAHDASVPVTIDAMPVLGHEGTHIFGVTDAFPVKSQTC